MIPNLRTGLLTVALATPIAAQQFVAELDPNPSTAYDPSPSNAVAGNGVVYFSANSPSHGRELFVTDGTALGTRVFADLFPGDQPSSPRAFGAFGASAVVQVGSTVTITDGTPAGTRVLWSGVDSTTEFFWLGLAGSRFVWAHRQRFGDLWTLVGSDGTSNGTVQLALVRDVTGATPRNGRLTIATDVSVAQVFSTDGLSLTAIATLPVTPESGFAALGAFDYFLVDDPSAQTTLWRTDGTTAGTSFVAALGPTQGISSIATLGAQVVIGAGNQLWVSDGTGPGTVALPVGVTFVRSLTTAGNALVFTAGSSLSGGPRLWRTD